VSNTTIGRAPQGVRPSRGRRLAPWAITAAATAVSTYALDALGTAAGVLLVASNALSGLHHWQAPVLVAAGAFALAAVGDSVASTDALVFLIGSGFAAAAYEYGLARLTRSVLRRRA